MYKTDIQIRFRDTDGMGHVNNAVFLTYLELARIKFFKQFFNITKSKDISFILARAEIDFKLPISLNDNATVKLWVNLIGNTSWWFEYQIVDTKNDSVIFAEAKTVQVVYNYDTNKKELISDEFKTFLKNYTIK